LEIVCVVPEVFTIPGPLIVSVFPCVSIVNEDAPASKLMPAAVILSLPDALKVPPSVTVPPPEIMLTKCATLPCTQGLSGKVDEEEELHERDPEDVLVVQVPLPAVVGLLSSAQNNGGRA